MYSLHSLRAALRWIEIAGYEVRERSRTNGGAVAGPLWLRDWEEEDANEREINTRNLITSARWLWWAARLDELAAGDMIDEESKAMARSSADKIRGFDWD
jgi:hypothetical protein